ncbi:hypothetical protein [Lachnobacterium bovis]|uniref:Uncharacterized protein n=1 Tax=Lachnobacterium bovis TaxID=140626 RepID=A0A1H9U3J7_9FIRM|nr:hypothetical protein [Lachnobacterium bovis]SES04016.1 hypothetical protein SAMN02910429_01909 [Lachnobacterium bovis]
MKEVIKFRIEKFRLQFSLYGFANCLGFFLIFSALLILPKFGMYKFKHYTATMLLITIIFVCFAIEFVLKKIKNDDVLFVETFFDNLDAKKYTTYMRYYKYIVFQIFFLYFICPFEIKYLDDCLTFIAFVELITAIEVAVFSMTSHEIAMTIKSVITFAFLGAIILTNHKIISLPIDGIFEHKFRILKIAITAISVLLSLKYLSIESPTHNGILIKKLSSFKVVKKEKDYLFFIRKIKFMEALYVFALTIFLSMLENEKSVEQLITFSAAISYMFANTYIELTAYETGNFILFHTADQIKHFKFKKMINTLKIATSLFLLPMIPMVLITSLKVVVIAFLIAILSFLISTLLIPFSYERRKTTKTMVSNLDQICYMVAMICIFLILATISNKII